MAIGVGLHTSIPRFRAAKKLVEDLRKQYKDFKIISVGHSLGGTLAEESGADYAVTYAKGSGLRSLGLSRQFDRSRIESDIRGSGDLISYLSKRDRTKKYQYSIKGSGFLKSHSLRGLKQALRRKKLVKV